MERSTATLSKQSSGSKSSDWAFQVSGAIVPAVVGRTAVIAGEFGACGHGGDQGGWALYVSFLPAGFAKK